MTCNTAPNGFYMLGQALAQRAQRKKAAELFADAVHNGRCDEARTLAMQYGNQRDLGIVQSQCVTPEAAAAEGQQALMASVTASVQAGRCDDAKSTALNAGRLDLADQVVRVCTAK
jgi:hypothetical protein